MNVLFLFESNLPSSYHNKTLSPGELRVIAAQKQVEKVIALGPFGKSFYNIKAEKEIKSESENKISLVRFKTIFPYYFKFIPLFFHALNIINKEKIDLIHAESPHISGIAAVILKKIFKIKIAVEYRASYDEIFQYHFKFIPLKIKSFIFWKVCNWVFGNADLILANSQTYASILQKRYPKFENVHFYNPGVKLPKQVTSTKKKKIIGFLGRLYPDKGAIYLLKAINLISKELSKLGWKVELAGDGPEKNRLQEYIINHQLNKIVSLVGTQDRWSFLSKISILVNPTIVQAALEMVNIEAAALKIPTICFGNKLIPETVRHQQTGIKIKNKDFQNLAWQIKFLVNHHQQINKMGNEAAYLYKQQYTYIHQVMNLRQAYRSIGY